MNAADFEREGAIVFPPEESISNWLETAAPVVEKILSNLASDDPWLRHGKTWYAGVNVLPNDKAGRVANGIELDGAGIRWLSKHFQFSGFDRGQVSVIYPGYPKQDAKESDAAHRFRIRRMAAHVDGLIPSGPQKRRFIEEPHAFVLGIPMGDYDEAASPMVYWPGSHHLFREKITTFLQAFPVTQWAKIDVTNAYADIRRHIMDQFDPVPLCVPKGGCYVLDRHLLHGVAPWADSTTQARKIVYFRPDVTGGISEWIKSSWG